MGARGGGWLAVVGQDEEWREEEQRGHGEVRGECDRDQGAEGATLNGLCDGVEDGARGENGSRAADACRYCEGAEKVSEECPEVSIFASFLPCI